MANPWFHGRGGRGADPLDGCEVEAHVEAQEHEIAIVDWKWSGLLKRVRAQIATNYQSRTTNHELRGLRRNCPPNHYSILNSLISKFKMQKSGCFLVAKRGTKKYRHHVNKHTHPVRSPKKKKVLQCPPSTKTQTYVS